MEITDIRIFHVNGDTLKAYVTIVFDNSFLVRDIKIISNKNKLFVAMPNKRLKNGTYKDVAHPLNQDMRDSIEKEIIRKYLEYVEEE